VSMSTSDVLMDIYLAYRFFISSIDVTDIVDALIAISGDSLDGLFLLREEKLAIGPRSHRRYVQLLWPSWVSVLLKVLMQPRWLLCPHGLSFAVGLSS